MTANSRLRPLDAAPAERSTTRIQEAAKQLLCGGFAGSVAKTVTAPFSRLTILFQVHSLVTTKHSRPRFAMSLRGGVEKIIERGGVKSLWRGNMTSVLHRFPYSAINFFVYENTMDALSATQKDRHEAESEKQSTIARRLRTNILQARHQKIHRPCTNSYPVLQQEQWRVVVAIHWTWSVLA
jgi:hypothetical protein